MKTVYIKRNDLFKNITMLLCNEIVKVDESFIDNNIHIFYYDCDTCNGSGEIEKDGQVVKCEDCYGDGSLDAEPYQYFLSSLNSLDEERFSDYGVEYGYSDKLGLHVIPIYDYGTTWDAFSYSKEVSDDYELSYNESFTRVTPY